MSENSNVEYNAKENQNTSLERNINSKIERFQRIFETVPSNIINAKEATFEVKNRFMECKNIELRRSQLEVQTAIQLQNIANKFEISKMYITAAFGQRQEALSKHYLSLDKAMQSNDRELITVSLREISTIVTTIPLEDFNNFFDRWNNKSQPLEFDF